MEGIAQTVFKKFLDLVNKKEDYRKRSIPPERPSMTFSKEDAELCRLFLKNPDEADPSKVEVQSLDNPSIARIYDIGKRYISNLPEYFSKFSKGRKGCYVFPLNGFVEKTATDKNGLADVWKNVDFYKWHIQEKLEGYNAVIDWTSDAAPFPFYVVMHNAKGGDLLSNLKDLNKGRRTANTLFNFIEEYLINKSQVVEGQALRATELYVQAIRAYLPELQIEEDERKTRQRELQSIEDNLRKIILQEMPVSPAIPDPHPSNLLFLEDIVSVPDGEEKIVIVDNGWKQALQKDLKWTKEHSPYLVPVEMTLGHLYTNIVLEGDEQTKEATANLDGKIKLYLSTNRWKEQPDKYDKLSSELIAIRGKLVHLGGLYSATLFEYGHPGAERGKNMYTVHAQGILS